MLSIFSYVSGHLYVYLWWCSNNQCLKWVNRSSGCDCTEKDKTHIPKRVLWTSKIPPSSPWGQRNGGSNNGKHLEPKIRNAYPCFLSCVRCIFHKYDMSSRQIQSTEGRFFRRYSIYQADIFNLEKSVWQGYSKEKGLLTKKLMSR